ncbi:hypothetical protein KIF59_14675 [Enterobacter cloacae subsp. cloacae]|nr:hypothetical protein [Enterobacter cloacae subsp. cloacae]
MTFSEKVKPALLLWSQLSDLKIYSGYLALLIGTHAILLPTAKLILFTLSVAGLSRRLTDTGYT